MYLAILYTFAVKEYSKGLKNGHDTVSYKNYTYTKKYSSLDSSLNFEFKKYKYDTVSIENKNFDTLCNVNTVRYFGSTLIYVPPTYTILLSGIGLGNVFHKCSDDDIWHKIYMFSYIKKNSQCGTPDVLLTDESVGMEDKITAYPNPVQNTLHVTVDLHLFSEYQLLNQAGQVVLIGTINTEILTVDVSKLSAGLYSLKLIGNNSSVQKTIIKQ